MRILITGSRTWPDKQSVVDAIEKAWHDWYIQDPPPEGIRYMILPTIIEGECEYGGADIHAREHAEYKGYPVDPYPVTRADIAEHGKRAYYLRNKKMVDSGADICLAFIHGASRGTKMTIRLAEEAGIPVIPHYYGEVAND